MEWNVLKLVDLDGLDTWWGRRNVTLQRMSFVLNHKEMETEEEADQSGGRLTGWVQKLGS